jgi:hypothetical protein
VIRFEYYFSLCFISIQAQKAYPFHLLFFTPSRYLGLDWLCICILLVEIISSKQQSAIEKESSSLGLFRRLDDIVHDSLIHVE